MRVDFTRLCAVAVACAFASLAFAQQYVYPAKGQKPEQQKKDEAECATWATQQSGFDPSKPPPPPPPAQPTTASGSKPGAGLRGAAAGAVVGEVAGGNASSGAAAGAVVARSASRRENRAEAQQQQSAAGQQVEQGQAAFSKARAACLEGRGYTVK